MIGFGANRRGGRLPSLLLVALAVVLAVLSFNYWTAARQQGRLRDEAAEARAQVKRTDAARSRLEKRNTELMAQADAHRKQAEQKDADYRVLESKVQGRETLIKKCTDDKMKLQQDFTTQITDIQRLKEQLQEIKDEFLKQEEHMREVKKNSTTLERRLEYESSQCGRQIKQLTKEYEESRKALELEVAKLRRMKLQQDFTTQITDIQRLKEQLQEIKDEFLKQEEHMREVKKNSTTLERRLEYESSQCGRQIKQLTKEYEESRKALELEVAKLRRSGGLDSSKLGVAGVLAQGQAAGEMEAERHTVAALLHGNAILKDEMGKPGSDAGMPGIEDSEVGKMEELQFGLKKPAITQKRKEAPNVAPGGGAAAVPGKGFRERALSLDQPLLQQQQPDRVGLGGGGGGGAAGGGAGGGEEEEEEEVEQQQAPVVAAVVLPLPGYVKPPVPQAVGDKPVLLAEQNKADMQADEFGEQNRQLPAPVPVKADSVQMKALPVPPNPVQVPKPKDPHRVRDQVPVQLPPHHQSRFFDENESPVDPQRGSKLADYNGDDGNVGEYEADKQAELAYNEEEDGDGGEEDVQDDEDRDMQGGRAGEYGKQRHQAADIL